MSVAKLDIIVLDNQLLEKGIHMQQSGKITNSILPIKTEKRYFKYDDTLMIHPMNVLQKLQTECGILGFLKNRANLPCFN